MRPLLVLVLALAGCGTDRRIVSPPVTGEPDLAAPLPDLLPPPIVDLATMLEPDGACVSVSEQAQVERLPVDIIWIVDNSSSMKPAVEAVKTGLNDFAALIAASNIDYHLVMLSVRSKQSPIMVNGGTRYPVCIPPPLAGDMQCGNGPRFFHSNIDIKSTQPLEQLLGTLAQTDGYRPGQTRGGEPWAMALRPEATKTIVVVTDDNSRFSATDFETFRGGQNPAAPSVSLPPGVLDPSWKGLFDGYLFDAIYGYGSDVDPSVLCKFLDGTMPASPGPVYTRLVSKTGGVRAKLCDGAMAWQAFFAQVAQSVVKTAKLSCDLAIPPPPGGQQAVDPSKVNVRVVAGMVETTLPKVANAAACGVGRGWYYDDEQMPKRVLLCPGACTFAQDQVRSGGRIDVAFGCQTIVQ